MARFPATGVWFPGPINTLNSPSPTFQTDFAGNPYYMGTTPGKIFFLGPQEVNNFAAPGTQLYDGAYQVVQLDSGATAANATNGLAAFFRLDSGPTQGANPESDYNIPTVTTEDIVTQIGGSLALFAGVFINPATLAGVANGPTPGNYCVIWVGAGRALINYGGTQPNSPVALGDNIEAGGHNYNSANAYGSFIDRSASTTAPTGNAVGKAASVEFPNNTGLLYIPEVITRTPF